MPPKPKYAADDILDAAVSLTRERGIAVLSARTLAIRLGCSTAPIFRHYDSMECLLECVMEHIINEFVSVVSSSSGEDAITSVGNGWLRFAAEEPRLYEALFLRMHPWSRKWLPVRESWARHLGEESRYAELCLASRNAIVGRVCTVLHGIGLELWSGRIQSRDYALLIRELVMPVVDAAVEQEWFLDPHHVSQGSDTASR